MVFLPPAPLMAALDWQALVAYGLLALALGYLARRVWRIVRSGTRDGAGHGAGCGSCPRNPAAAKPQNLVQLGDATPAPPRASRGR